MIMMMMMMMMMIMTTIKTTMIMTMMIRDISRAPGAESVWPGPTS
jgi:hypothetical protein